MKGNSLEQNNISREGADDVELIGLIDERLITKLDSLKTPRQLHKKYSEMYAGGVYAIQTHNRLENPDWMSQSANSFREILYILQKTESKELKKILNEHFAKSLTPQEVNEYGIYLGNLYKLFSDLTHHFSKVLDITTQKYIIGKNLEIGISPLSKENYFKAIRQYNEYLKLLVVTALEMHKRIDQCISNNQKDKDLVRIFFDNSRDSKIYFLSLIDESWLQWLWTNGFFVDLKKPAEDTTRYSYQMPELEYLSRMVEKNPELVGKIINSVSATIDSFNPEVIDHFIRITGLLPSEQIKTLTKKILDEKWVYLMRNFRMSGYKFESIIKKLIDAKENDSILELAQSLLIVKNMAEIAEKSNGFQTDDPFYVSDLNSSGIFEAMANIAESHKEESLQITTAILGEIVRLAELDDSKVFEYSDLFSFYDVDFFMLEIENKHSHSYRKDIKNLAATIKKLIEETLGKKCNTPADARRLFSYIDSLPSCRAILRLRLFTLTQCPKEFIEELKATFFKLFEIESYYNIEGGAEYKKALKIGFPILSDNDKRIYVAQVLSYFSKKAAEHPDQSWHKRTGWEILSSIYISLTEDEVKKCEEVFGMKCDPKYIPEVTIPKVKSGFISPLSPVKLSDYTIDQIIVNLQSEWVPKKLEEQFKNDDFLSPRGAEGLGDALKEDVKKRTDDYLNRINYFFDRDTIDPTYLYSLLRGIEEMLRNKQTLNLVQNAQLLSLFNIVRKSGEEKTFNKKINMLWRIDWIEVHKVMIDILKYILQDKENKLDFHKQHRDKIIDFISYLLTIQGSPSKEHEKPEYGDPFTVAINSVRGKAFEAFVVLTENDGNILADDVKALYGEVLTENSLAVRFVIGRYLATFYFRDKHFIIGLLPEIFPKDDSTKKDLYLASWEGYLSDNLYGELFIDLKDYYKHAILLDPKIYTERKYSNDLDMSIAIHLALAFVHLGLEIHDPLFNLFWTIPNTNRHKQFISFIGRSCLTRDNVSDEWLIDNKVSKERLLNFWDWALKHNEGSETLAGFGFWINPDKEILDDNSVIDRIHQTLRVSNGNIEWDYGLMKRLPIFSKKNGDKTLEIITYFLLDSTSNLNPNRGVPMFSIEDEIKKSLDLIYRAGDEATKKKVVDFINLLIEKGSNLFWGLKEIIEK